MEVPQGTKHQIFIITYFLFISLVPDSPSYYRLLLLVDSVGTLLSLLSLGFLELFLNSRPLNQKNVLNSQLHLIVYFQLAYTIRAWIASAAGSIFHTITTMMLNSYPQVFLALLMPRHYSIALIVAYCSHSISKLILVISPATFQNIRASTGFWFSLLAALLVPLLNMVLYQIKCGNEADILFENTKIFREELGLTNLVLGGAEINVTTAKKGGWELKDKVQSCAGFPTLMVIIISTITLEIIKCILVMIIERIKINNKIHNSSLLPTGQNTNLNNPALNNPLHLIEPVGATNEVVLNPGDLKNNIEVHTSSIIYVRPAPGATPIDLTTPTIGEIVTVTEEIVTLSEEIVTSTEEVAASTEEIVTLTEEIVTATEEVAALTEELAASTEEVDASTEEIVTLSEEIDTSTEEVAASRPAIRDISLSKTIKNTLKLILFRAGTLSLIGFTVCIVALIPFLSHNNNPPPFFSKLLTSIARYFAFFLPLAWILFDRDIRVNTFLKLRSLWHRYCI